MKVCMITQNFPRNERDMSGVFLYELFSHLGEIVDIHVIAPHYKGSKTEEKSNGLSIHRFRYAYPESLEILAYHRGFHKLILRRGIFFKLLGLFFLISAIVKTCYVIKKENISLIHSHWILPPGFIGYICAKLTGRPIVITSHGSDLRDFAPLSMIGRIISYIACRSDAFIVVGEELLELALSRFKIPQSKVILLPLGVDIKKFRYIPKKMNKIPSILFLGALEEFKGPKYLLSAIPNVLRNIPDCTFTFAGDGILNENLRMKTKKLGISKSTKFLGSVPHDRVPLLINEAWIVTFLSPYENYPSIALQEAMACRKAIVATRTGRTEFLVKNKITGLLTDLDPDNIAQALVNLILNEELRDRLGERARNLIIKNYSLSKTIKRLIIIYRKILRR